MRPPRLGAPGWMSDTFRQSPAQSENTEPHSGAVNGACRTTTSVDCGIFQDVTAPADGTYTFTVYANASRTGAWVGANVNGSGVEAMPVQVRGTGAYGSAYSMTFSAHAGDTIRVWLVLAGVTGLCRDRRCEPDVLRIRHLFQTSWVIFPDPSSEFEQNRFRSCFLIRNH